MTLLNWIRDRLFRTSAPSSIEQRAEHAYAQLRDVNERVKGFRTAKDLRTGNPVADMARGTYRPRHKGEASR